VQAVAARADFVADHELAVLLGQPPEQLSYGLGPVRDLAAEAHLAGASRLGDRHCDPGLVRTGPDARRPTLVHGPSPIPGTRRRPVRRNPRRRT